MDISNKLKLNIMSWSVNNELVEIKEIYSMEEFTLILRLKGSILKYWEKWTEYCKVNNNQCLWICKPTFVLKADLAFKKKKKKKK